MKIYSLNITGSKQICISQKKNIFQSVKNQYKKMS
jgi:hypothetical protein